jgi:putative transposase
MPGQRFVVSTSVTGSRKDMGYSQRMPWKETCAMNQRMELIEQYWEEEFSVSELAWEYGVSRKTVHKWINRFKQKGAAGLEELSRAPHHQPNAISVELERRIVEWKARKPLWGAPKIHSKLLGLPDCPSEKTVSNVLARLGLTRKPRRRGAAVPSAGPLVHCTQSNQVWCVDFKGYFRTGDGRRCDPLTISDGHSRYLLRCQALGAGTALSVVQPLFIGTFREYGLPESIRSDNGPPFASTGLGGLSVLSAWWIRLGIRLERIQPGHPEQNGRHERMHRTLKEATAKPPRASLQAQQRAFDAFRQEYNHERPHEGLGQRPPAEWYAPSNRDYPERLPAARGYPDDWQKRRVLPAGWVKWKGQTVQISKALIGQEIGFKPIEDGLWGLYFETVELGVFDERTRRIRRCKSLCQVQSIS